MPQPALTAADHAVITREMARATAHRLGHRVIFSPKPDPDLVGNGVHIHMSLVDAGGPAGDPRAGRTDGAEQAGAAFLCRRAASHACHLRDHRALAGLVSSPHAQCLGADRDRPRPPGPWRQPAHLPGVRCRDRGDIARQFHVEFRATDAAASPYLALGAVIFAGVDGIRRELPLPARPARRAHLPRSLPEALDRLAASETVGGWFGPTHFDAYLRFKRVEAEKVAGLSPAELCARYAEVY